MDEGGTAERVRVALIATPRSGSTWLKLLLARAWRVPAHASYGFSEADAASLPDECVLQLHLPYSPAWYDRLRNWGFRIVVQARHPLDVLVSILHFCRFEPEVGRWLGTDCPDEDHIRDVSPASLRFLRYATSSRCADLLAVSAQWWAAPGIVRARYEDLLSDPTDELRRLVAAVGWPARSPDLAAEVEATALKRLRPLADNNHFWQGRQGLWRRIVPASTARAVAQQHADVFAALGHELPTDVGPTPEEADANWAELTRSEWAQFLRDQRQQREDLCKKLAQSQLDLAQTYEQLVAAEQARAELWTAMDETWQVRLRLAQRVQELEELCARQADTPPVRGREAMGRGSSIRGSEDADHRG